MEIPQARGTSTFFVGWRSARFDESLTPEPALHPDPSSWRQGSIARHVNGVISVPVVMMWIGQSRRIVGALTMSIRHRFFGWAARW